jgi:hypothetical protein
LSDPAAETIAFIRTEIAEHLGVSQLVVLAPPKGFIMAPQSPSAAGRPLRVGDYCGVTYLVLKPIEWPHACMLTAQ